ncbi:hypothetical protein BDV25DRAFT_135522 [Aspergillus avenaceus]|uniref:NmrA-like domain-containing protein n=1 Tax=Aspergillus avenaceus TaxID=36643 RepID=A0A5N6U8G8_ASPAV|nr:hypothetical protein BDV25DRAFT_135522 [Aspergillus avenaceus]
MGIIAVAGGTGSIGRTIVEALVERGAHDVFVLTRKARESDNVKFLAVDYGDVNGIAQALEEARVDTVICAFGMESDAISQAQINLIHAAERSTVTKRFMVSGYDMLFKDEQMTWLPIARWARDADKAVAATNLEHTRVVNGLFLDYYGIPHWKSYLKPWINGVHVPGKWAVLPGDGLSPINFVTTKDMARFVTRLMDSSGWKPVSFIAGQTTTFKEICEIAERARGERFFVQYESLESLRNGRISFPEFVETGLEGSGQSTESIFAMFHLTSATGGYTITSDDTLDRRFPDIHITTAEEVIESSWRGR